MKEIMRFVKIATAVVALIKLLEPKKARRR